MLVNKYLLRDLETLEEIQHMPKKPSSIWISAGFSEVCDSKEEFTDERVKSIFHDDLTNLTVGQKSLGSLFDEDNEEDTEEAEANKFLTALLEHKQLNTLTIQNNTLVSYLRDICLPTRSHLSHTLQKLYISKVYFTNKDLELFQKSIAYNHMIKLLQISDIKFEANYNLVSLCESVSQMEVFWLNQCKLQPVEVFALAKRMKTHNQQANATNPADPASDDEEKGSLDLSVSVRPDSVENGHQTINRSCWFLLSAAEQYHRLGRISIWNLYNSKIDEKNAVNFFEAAKSYGIQVGHMPW